MFAWVCVLITSAASVPHVNLQVSLNDDHSLQGEAAWTYTNEGDQPLKEIDFLLYANFGSEKNPRLSTVANAAGYFNQWEPTRTAISQVQDATGAALPWSLVKAQPVLQTYNLENIYLRVALPKPIQPHQSTSLLIRFKTLIPHRIGDQGHYRGDTTWRFGWFPQPRYRVNNQWSDAIVLTRFTHETQLKVPGDSTAIIGANKSFQEGQMARAESAVPVRSIPIVVSSNLHTIQKRIGYIDVYIHTYKDGAIFDTSAEEAEEKLAQLEKILAYYQTRFGVYRFETLHVIESPTTHLSMAADGLILLGDQFFIHNRLIVSWDLFGPLGEVALAHELAHQWFGIGVGVDFDAGNWLSEGLAQLMSLTYAHEQFGQEGNDMLSPNWLVRGLYANFYGTALPTNQEDHFILPNYRDHARFNVDEAPAQSFRNLHHGEENFYRLYHKSYLSLRALHSVLGQEKTTDMLRGLYNKQSDILDLATLEKAVDAQAGAGKSLLSKEFWTGNEKADWIINDVHSIQQGDKYTHRIDVAKSGNLHLGNTLIIKTEHSSQEVDLPHTLGKDSFTVETDEPLLTATIDENSLLPDTDRRNNHWPRQQQWWLFAAPTSQNKTTIAINPLPLTRRYLVGANASGHNSTQLAWEAGGGLKHFGVDDNARWTESVAYANITVPLKRLSQLQFSFESDYLRHPLAGDLLHNSVEASHIWTFYEATNLGNTGVIEQPRTTLSANARWRNTQVAGPGILWQGNNQIVHQGNTLTLGAGVVRNNFLNYGHVLSCEVLTGITPPYYTLYAGLTANIHATTVVTYLGTLEANIKGGMLTPSGPNRDRFSLEYLPATDQQLVIRPYDAGFAGQLRVVRPILRDLRIKSELLLATLVFNDLSLLTYYGAAWGGTWRPPIHAGLFAKNNPTHFVGAPALGEMGLGARVGLSSFFGSLNVDIGIATPTWPGIPQWSQPRLFLAISSQL